MLKQLRAWLAYRIRVRLGFPFQELALERIRNAGFMPKSILDVGASYGPFADQAWKCWPAAHIHCFEPEPEYVRALERHAESDPRLHVCAALVGASCAETQVYYHLLGGSTVLTENTDNPDHPVTTCGPPRVGRMITIADYCARRKIVPEFLKIDVQGYELEVMKGAEPVLDSVDVILTEVNHTELFCGVPLAAELIGWLSSRGYALHDICGIMRRGDGVLWQSDMLFVRHSSPLRSMRRGG